MKAKIIEGKIYCGYCKEPIGHTKDYRQVMYEGKSYTKFDRYCSDSRCSYISSYLLDMSIDEVTRITVDDRYIEDYKINE